ncbi:MAG: hypothetical protein NPIRA02_34030 [Nitrospirales bacterium]|nr:MAG: hypothetical protein NPIRA02_34030 [Nitrospirales bacterium]
MGAKQVGEIDSFFELQFFHVVRRRNVPFRQIQSKKSSRGNEVRQDCVYCRIEIFRRTSWVSE